MITFITGASSGIGRALALRLAAEGDAMALAARRADLLADLAETITAEGGRALALACDVTDRRSVEAAVASCEGELGPIDRLVVNAGIGSPSPGTDFVTRHVEKTLEVNLLGAVNTIGAVLPAMVERDLGHVIGISSLAGYRGLPGAAAYCASKAALSTLLESLRMDLRRTGVAVTTVCPGFVRTPMTDRNRFPMPFMVEVDDAARTIARAIASRRAFCAFPRSMALAMAAMRLVPRPLYEWVAARPSSPRMSDTSG
ncbi:MAG: SDR family NAD(P)-dependent oxidoreductase [Planctomycetota bacterium]|jgi:short-subunit dehydrogenase|nr:SDR family NAD(P)-dependent oxidoreductase [Planctomycetota bacterium]MDP6764153.1 SDR family NAD(P)-dependent oxidoreductase [Planctomycetota bacterium]MDP6988222.1 SDR family NAD(P)-dependent oxidoreductase [Planctomycetota bacterium]